MQNPDLVLESNEKVAGETTCRHRQYDTQPQGEDSGGWAEATGLD